MAETIVRTADELKKAVESKAAKIIVKGELAEKLNTATKINKASKWAIGLLGASLAAAPFTGGGTAALTAAAAGPIAALTGIEITAIVLAVSLGLSVVLLIGKGYRGVNIDVKRTKTKGNVTTVHEAGLHTETWEPSMELLRK